ncbi:MAG: dipeptidase PepE [Glaciecola sp.]
MSTILMLSSSREGDTPYLSHAVNHINETLNGITDVVFVPYAGVTISHDQYTSMVQQALPQLRVTGLHELANAQAGLKKASAILVGGGNTYVLLDTLYKLGLMDVIKQCVTGGIPYIGWSAGSNICGATIKTTNDMPIVEPPSFDALGFLPFQINPHFSNYQPPGHNGETREQRLMEFSTLNPDVPIVGIKEGSALKLVNEKLTLLGPHEGVLIAHCKSQKIRVNSDLSHLLSS